MSFGIFAGAGDVPDLDVVFVFGSPNTPSNALY